MNLQVTGKILVLSVMISCNVSCNMVDLVKTCQDFRKTFLDVCELVGKDQCTEKMGFLKEHLKSGGTILYYDIIIHAIDDCITLLSKNSDTMTDAMIIELRSFKNQINSDEIYDLNLGCVIKRETLRSGKTKIKRLTYNARRCYKATFENISTANT